MACGSCGRRRFEPVQVTAPVGHPRPPVPPPPMPTPKVVSVPAPAGGKDAPCEKCGWLYKRVRYIDVKTNSVVEKMCCSNRNCPNYSV